MWHCSAELKNLSVAVLSQAKKYECGIAQPSSSIACDNVLTEWYARTTAKNRASTNAIIVKNWDTQTDRYTRAFVELLRN